MKSSSTVDHSGCCTDCKEAEQPRGLQHREEDGQGCGGKEEHNKGIPEMPRDLNPWSAAMRYKENKGLRRAWGF